ncbi:ComEA family DNA-binding protein [Actinomyces dentalis]|uniref:ComEA family DNA-binding protein n=1 Tax=Actinomyces dentalis TaxID=272548 RepID=UPI00316AC177
MRRALSLGRPGAGAGPTAPGERRPGRIGPRRAPQGAAATPRRDGVHRVRARPARTRLTSDHERKTGGRRPRADQSGGARARGLLHRPARPRHPAPAARPRAARGHGLRRAAARAGAGPGAARRPDGPRRRIGGRLPDRHRAPSGRRRPRRDRAARFRRGPAGAPAGRIVVHVVGAVVSPGVVVLADGARVADAIAAAGGAASDADTEQLNLARVLDDGEQVRVPHAGEQLAAPDPGPSPPGASGGGAAAGSSGGSTPGGGVVNINTAGVSELEALPGIGPALAARIVEYRDGHGPFASVDDLTDVPGIGPAKLEALRSQATV